MASKRRPDARGIFTPPIALLIVLLIALIITVAPAAAGQEPAGQPAGVRIADSDKVRVNVRFMAGYGVDEAQYGIGVESQGRIGYAIVEVSGKISERLSYRLDINPVHETQPLPACGEADYFYPNVAQAFGPAVTCDADGRTRVDDYRFIALDVLHQQGPIRQAYIRYQSASGTFSGQFGRFILPVGFDWEDAGSFTSKDATHIQRINAEASFGVMMTLKKPRVSFNVGAVLGEGNRFHDYDYFYSLDSSLDTNSSMSGVASATFQVAAPFEVRIAQKAGYTGSKVEYLPNFYASKRIDRATVASARYRPTRHTSLFGEYAWYTWGLHKTSAELIGWSDTTPIDKKGFYVGADASIPLTKRSRIGATVTHEELDRDDALIKNLAQQNQLRVKMGESERSTVVRAYVDLARNVRVGTYVTLLDNPFPWVSGIWRTEGPNAFQGPRGSNKWGIVARFSLD